MKLPYRSKNADMPNHRFENTLYVSVNIVTISKFSSLKNKNIYANIYIFWIYMQLARFLDNYILFLDNYYSYFHNYV